MWRLVVLCATAILVSCGDASSTLTQPSDPPQVTPPPVPSFVTVHGVVTDAVGGLVDDAMIEVAGPVDSWGERGHVASNARGAYTLRFSVSRYPDFEFLFRATRPGYAEQIVRTRVVDGLELNFELSPTQ